MADHGDNEEWFCWRRHPLKENTTDRGIPGRRRKGGGGQAADPGRNCTRVHLERMASGDVGKGQQGSGSTRKQSKGA